MALQSRAYLRYPLANDITRHTLLRDKIPVEPQRGALENVIDQGKSILDTLLPKDRDRVLRRAHESGQQRVRRVRDAHRSLGISTTGISNAWLKAYEMFDRERLLVGLDPARDVIFFNAELPGSFIIAAIQWLSDAKERGIVRSATFPMWLASSLHPLVQLRGPRGPRGSSTEPLGDIYSMWRNNPRHWLIEPGAEGLAKSGTGDLRSVEECQRIACRVKYRSGGGVALYVSDAGIDYDPSRRNKPQRRQETEAASVHAGQVLCCLDTLRPGGCALMKFYTVTRPWTFSLLTFLAEICFDESHLVKPPSSRPINSEVYFVGLGFRRDSAFNGHERHELVQRMLNAPPFNDTEPLLGWGASLTSSAAPLNILAASGNLHATHQCGALREICANCANCAKAIPPVPACGGKERI